MPTVRKRVVRKYQNFDLEDWKLRYLKTGELPYEHEANGFAALEFCWSAGAGLAWLKMRDHVRKGEFPYAENNFEQWCQWRQVREALGGVTS